MCRATEDGGRRCRDHSPLVQARDQATDRIRYNRRCLLGAVGADDPAAAGRYAWRLAADASTFTLFDPARPGVLSGVNLQKLPDAKLEALAAEPRVMNDDDALDEVLAEVDRRDYRANPGSHEHMAMSAAKMFVDQESSGAAKVSRAARRARGWAEGCRQIDQVLLGAAGARHRRPVYEALGIDVPVGTGDRTAQARADWKALCHSQYLDAEDYCRGRMLKRGSEDAGVDPHELFTRPAQWVRAHASEEFLVWQQSNPRLTFAQYAAQAMPDSDSWGRKAKAAKANSAVLDRF